MEKDELKEVRPESKFKLAWLEKTGSIDVLGTVPPGTVAEQVVLPYPGLQDAKDLQIGGCLDLAEATHRTGLLHSLCKRAPKVVCLVGSTRFESMFHTANLWETLAGNIVLTVGVFKVNHGALTEDQRWAINELHLTKIDMADEVFILNVGGYMGNGTKRELAYAREKEKVIRFLEPVEESARNT